MVGVNEDNFVVLVNTILVNPVRVQDTQVTASLADTLLRYTSQTSLGLEVVDTLADGLAVGRTLGDVFLAVAPADTDAVDNIALLGLVAKTTSLVGARWTRCAVDDVQLTVLPAPVGSFRISSRRKKALQDAPNTEKEPEDIRLLLFVQLANILVGSHLAG